MKIACLIISTFFFSGSVKILAQATRDSIVADSIKMNREARKKIYSEARKATIMSAILPGLGQAYNRKYWKIAVIYAGLGGFGYMFAANNDQYQYYRQNLAAENDGDPATANTSKLSSENLLSEKQYYKKNRDLAIIGMGVMYLLNIIDANVDAHLKTFDVSDDLSLYIKPHPFIYRQGTNIRTAGGLSFSLKF